MPWNRSKLKFLAKVLLPVVAALAFFMVAITWLLRSRIDEGFHNEARQSLAIAESGFTNLLADHANILQSQTASATEDKVFFTVADKIDRDAATATNMAEARQVGSESMIEPLTNIVSQLLGDTPGLAMFVRPRGELLTSVSHLGKFDGSRFVRAAFDPIERALAEETPANCVIQFDQRLFTVTAAPVSRGGKLLGALVMGIVMDDTALRQVKAANSEIVLVIDKHIAASTLKVGEPGLLDHYNNLRGADPQHRFTEIPLGDEPFVMTVGQLPLAAGGGDCGYALLSSYAGVESQIRSTERILFWTGLVGIIVGGTVVYLLVRQATKPLRELRDSAEAVGRGDFSHRVKIRSHDEVGELGMVFNQMTDNLQKSTAQLEKTVAALRDTQAKLLHSEKLSAVGEFVAGVAHELNNPLTALIGFAELLQMSDVKDEDRESLQRITVSAGRCHKIVQSLLSFARQRPPERKLTDVNHVLDAVIEILLYELRTNNIKIIKDYAPDLPKVLLDPHQVQQVFLNIVNNARQAIEAYRPHGSIRLVTRPLDGRVQVRFEDDGPGMSPETAAKIFDPFFTTKPVGKGTGLGLSLSYGIIQEHGGSINVESAAGMGTTFIIELPITKGAETAAAAGTPAPALRGQGKKILVVDDEEDIVELVRKTLERRGYTIRTALNGESALRHLSHDRFDLIISDWKMPGLNGQQLYERLLQIQPQSAERMIFMTGDVLSEKTEKYLSEREKICLAKPFSISEFERAVRETFEAA